MTNLYNKFKAYALAGALASLTGMTNYANAAEDEMGKYLQNPSAVTANMPQKASPKKASRKANNSKVKSSTPTEAPKSTQTLPGYHVGLSSAAFAEHQKMRAERHYLGGTLLGLGYATNDVQMPVISIGKLWDKYGLIGSVGYGSGDETPKTTPVSRPADPITGFSANGSRTESKKTRAAYLGLDALIPLKTYVKISEVQTSTIAAKPKWEIAESRVMWYATVGASLEQKVETTNTRTVENIVNALGQTVASKTNNYSKEETSNSPRINMGTGFQGRSLGGRLNASFGKGSPMFSGHLMYRFGNNRWPNPTPAKTYNTAPQKVPEKKAEPAKKATKKAAEKKTEKKN